MTATPCLPQWYPPGSLQGRFWRVEVLHASGEWRVYTEHHDEDNATRTLAYRRANDPSSTYRVVQSFRQFSS